MANVFSEMDEKTNWGSNQLLMLRQEICGKICLLSSKSAYEHKQVDLYAACCA